MSTDIYAKPDLSKKVRYRREQQQDGAEWEERTVEIYESADDIGDKNIPNQPQEGELQTLYHPPVQKTPLRPATLGLSVLLLLMLAVVIILSICFVMKNNKVKESNSELQARVTELQTLKNNSRKLEEEINQEKKKNEELQDRNGRLVTTNAKLQELSRKCCPDGWTRFGWSCYFISTEEKTWFESWTDCEKKDAHLVMIKGAEEQNFVSELTKSRGSWIGLRTFYVQPSGYQWWWVDGSEVTQSFWEPRYKNPGYNSFGVCCNSQGKWTWDKYEKVKTWICEN
ncbi:uncharacterized protein KZ484_007482 [Pholidichthys leucotaenia]